MPTEQEVYSHYSEQYERLIAREDHEGAVLASILRITSLAGKDVIDLGAGTGRLARLIAPLARSVHAYDLSISMLGVARNLLPGSDAVNWRLAVADHRYIPAESGSADLVVSGWSFCYLAVWGGDAWREALEQGYKEARRLLRPGGRLIIFETLGTGETTPNPPAHLSNYYAWLVEKGFQKSSIRTDYRFRSLEEAVELSTFFFGEELAGKVAEQQWVELPECTGVWWQ